MPLEFKVFTLGQMQNNTIVLYDQEIKKGLIIDPSFQNQPILDFVNEKELEIEMILCTHAHFDHFAGVPFLAESLKPRPKIAINKKDLTRWKDGGGSKEFNFLLQLPEDPDIFLSDGERILLGASEIEIREVPGHSPGSIIFYAPTLGVAFCGDAIFRENIGRTDLADGNHEQLLASIRKQVFTLPDNTVLIPGHGKSTTVSHEKEFNPFFN
jgi:glyoxylase-like metal-dependent hydrolase (beta-lactamase superfamily II)